MSPQESPGTYPVTQNAGSMGAIYGLNQSAFAGGQAAGAGLAAISATLWGLESTYVVAAALIAATAMWWLAAAPRRTLVAA